MVDYGGLSGIYGGYLAGTAAQADISLRQQQAEQAKLQTQDINDDKMALMALGRAFGVAAPIPPNAPPPMAPGQVSQPAPAAAMPDQTPAATPPSAAAPPPPSGTTPSGTTPIPPQAAPQAQGAAPAAPAQSVQAPPPAPQPPAAAPPAASGGVQPRAPAPTPPPAGGAPRITAPPLGLGIPGQMSVDQLAARIRAANPGIEKRPDLLVRAMAKGQQLLAPDQKAELAALQIQQKMDAVNQRLELGMLTLDMRRQLAEQANNFRMQIEALKQEGANQRTIDRLNAIADNLDKKIGARKEEKAEDRKTQIIRDLGKYGAQNIDPNEPLDKLEAQLGRAKFAQDERTAKLKVELNNGVQPSKEDIKFLGEALAAGDTTALQGWGYGKGSANVRAAIRDAAVQAIKEKNPNATGADLAAARANFTSQIAAARTLGTREGALTGTVQEIQPLGKIALDLSGQIPRTQYPSINSMKQAVARGTGDPKIVRFMEANNALMTAYAGTMSRTGRTTDFSMRRADQVLSTAYSQGQYQAGVQQLETEANAVLQAQRSGRQALTSEISGQAPPAAPAAPSAPGGAGQDNSDPLGIR